ncbi:MAG: hypothetical protein SAK29_42780 [Scytonema sp. PMC 1069.18]|nr:hypothetical protein [Scytonema sp. PMC 1069.18]MEC4881526.1 hypothetical protein [Scytonema sp. PMC 1070.18]
MSLRAERSETSAAGGFPDLGDWRTRRVKRSNRKDSILRFSMLTYLQAQGENPNPMLLG